MRQIYRAGGFGKLVYSEGEYFHYMSEPIPSFRDWRVGLPPQWYPTHSNAYYVCVTGGSFTEVSCMGMPSLRRDTCSRRTTATRTPSAPRSPCLRTSEGGMARMAVSWDTPGPGVEVGRVRGQRGLDGGHGLRRRGEDACPTSARPPLAARRRPGRPRRLARPPHERVRHGDPRRPQAAGGHRRWR